MSIDLRGIHKTFGAFVALDRIDLEIADGELVALLGLSGSGKTTLLRIIAGLETPSAGTVQFFGHDARSLSVRDRKIGFVFQHYALFRHMTVFENVAFAMRVLPRASRPPEGAVRARFTSCCDSCNWISWPIAIRPNYRADSGSALRSRGRWRFSPASCCSTSASDRSMRECGGAAAVAASVPRTARP